MKCDSNQNQRWRPSAQICDCYNYNLLIIVLISVRNVQLIICFIKYAMIYTYVFFCIDWVLTAQVKFLTWFLEARYDVVARPGEMSFLWITTKEIFLNCMYAFPFVLHQVNVWFAENNMLSEVQVSVALANTIAICCKHLMIPLKF